METICSGKRNSSLSLFGNVAQTVKVKVAEVYGFEGKPYWTLDNPDGYSADDLHHLETDEQVELMKAWFYQNLEDLALKAPYVSAEGGYQ